MKWFTMRCPWCGVELRSPDVEVGMTLGCPNQTGGCGRVKRDEIGRRYWVPFYLKIAKVAAVLLLFMACTHKQPALRRLSVPVAHTDSMMGTDTVRKGDSTFYTDWVQTTVTTVRTFPPRIVAPAIIAGIPFGAFHVPIDSLNRPSLDYSAAVRVVSASSLKSDLSKAKSRGAKLILAISRSRTKDANGLSVGASRSELLKWDWGAVRQAVKDTTVLAVYIGDDITASEWGPHPPYLARYDSIARIVDSLATGTPTVVRARPTELTGWKWQWLTTAWAQYKGPYREGTPEKYAATQVASAKAQKLGLVLASNYLDGGCGPTSACLPNIPGTSILGTFVNAASVRRYQLSAAEFYAYEKVFVAEPYNCASIGWQYSPVWNGGGRSAAQTAAIKAFDTRPDIRAAAKAIRVLASGRPFTSCKQR